MIDLNGTGFMKTLNSGSRANLFFIKHLFKSIIDCNGSGTTRLIDFILIESEMLSKKQYRFLGFLEGVKKIYAGGDWEKDGEAER